MRRTLALLLTLCILLPCLAGRSRYEGTFTRENGTTFTTFTFGNFVGTHTVKMKRTGLDDGQFYYRAALTEGSMAVSYKMGWHDIENPLFNAEAGMPLDSCGGYIWDGSIFITFTSEVPVSGEIVISFEKLPKDGCPFEWVGTAEGHSMRMLCDCCDAPDVVEPHEDRDGDMVCDICGYEIILIDPPTNHFLRNQAGAEWLNEITAEDIAEIKMISTVSGVAPGTPKNISSSTDKAVIARVFEEYYWLDTWPISKENGEIDGGGAVTVRFILKDGTERTLYINNRNYRDTNGNYFELLYTPKFEDTDSVTKAYGFIAYIGTGTVYDGNNNPVCEIPVDELEYIITGYDFGLFANGYDYYINTEFGKLYFAKVDIFASESDGHELVRVDYYFIVENDTEFCYRLVGKNLDALIATYCK